MVIESEVHAALRDADNETAPNREPPIEAAVRKADTNRPDGSGRQAL